MVSRAVPVALLLFVAAGPALGASAAGAPREKVTHTKPEKEEQAETKTAAYANPLDSLQDPSNFSARSFDDVEKTISTKAPQLWEAIQSLQKARPASPHFLKNSQPAPVDQVKCVGADDTPDATGIPRAEQEKYQTRAASQCERPEGMWGSAIHQPAIRFKYRAVAALFGLREGSTVLDWGAGCGHQIDIVARERNCVAAGTDLIPSNIKWAKEHMKFVKEFCTSNEKKLPFADGVFDAVVSNAVLLHLPSDDAECQTLRGEIMRVMKPGGCAWFGWNHGSTKYGTRGHFASVPKEYWAKCFSKEPMGTFMEKELFGVTEQLWIKGDPEDSQSYGPPDSYSLFFCKPVGA